MVQVSHRYLPTGKTIAWTRWTFAGKVMFLLFNMLCRFVIAFLPRSKVFYFFIFFLISWPQSPLAVILKPKKIECITVSIVSPSICHEVIGLDALIFISAFSLSSFTFIKRLFSSSSLSAIRLVLYANLRLLIFFEVIDISLSNLDSNLCFIQPACHFMYSVYKLNSRETIFSLKVVLSQFGTSPCSMSGSNC